MALPDPVLPVDSWIAELAPSIEVDAARIVASARTVLKLDLSDPRVAKTLELSALVALKRALAAELAEAGELPAPEVGYRSATPPVGAPEALGRIFEAALAGEPAGAAGLPDDAITRIAAAAAEAARQAVLDRCAREREAAEARAAVETAQRRDVGESGL